MRIDIIQPAPIPEIPKVSEGNSTSASQNNDFNRQLKKYISGTGNPGEQTADQINEKKFKDEVDKLNEKMQRSGRKLQFKIHKNPNQIIAQLVDSTTGEIVDEIPSEKILDMISSLGKTNGQNIDKKV